MKEIFTGPGSFLMNYCASKGIQPKVKRLRRHKNALDEVCSSHSLTMTLKLINGEEGEVSNTIFTGPEFEFT